MDPQATVPSSLTSQSPINDIPSPALIAAKFDHSIALALSAWPALTLAVQNQWGGPSSADKRDWLAGVISDLFSAPPSPLTPEEVDEEYVMDVLLQVMFDEFDVTVEDGSEEEVARTIMRCRSECERGDFRGVEEMYRRWLARGSKGEDSVVGVVEGPKMEQEVSGDEWSEDSQEDGGVDVKMDDAPVLVQVNGKEKPPPEVDQDGFTKVVSKKKR